MTGRAPSPRAARPARRLSKAAIVAGLCLAAAAAQAEIIDIAWQDAERFDRTLTVAPGKFAELCGPLAVGKRVAWSFEAEGALNFNIHYHLGKEVRYPARIEQSRGSAGELAVDTAQDYCWMWTNKSAVPARLAVKLRLK